MIDLRTCFFFAGTKWLSWHLGHQKSVLGRIDIKLCQSDRKNSQLSWAFFGKFLSKSEALQIAKIAVGKFGSKNAKIQGSKCDNSHLGQLGEPIVISVVDLGLSRLGVISPVKWHHFGQKWE